MKTKTYVAPSAKCVSVNSTPLMITSLIIDPNQSVDTVGSNESNIWDDYSNKSKVWD